MAFDAALVDRLLSCRHVGWSERLALALTAVAVSLGAAACITYYGETAWAAKENLDRVSSFEDRFFSASTPVLPPGSAALQPLGQSALAVAEMKLRVTDFRDGYVNATQLEQAKPTVAAAAIPLPRTRPATADLEARPRSARTQAENAGLPNDRTFLQKLSDLLPGRVTLASLGPDGGLFGRGPDLASLGYDQLTAVYDISAHVVYLPNGLSLEAHSGMGSLRDNPGNVSVPNAGATPPAVYELKPREKLFHGIQALRMIPAEGSDTSGRSGLLVHSFMLGTEGDSNGCVSIRNYDRFLKAFNDKEINRLVVVPSLKSGTLALQRSTSQS